MDTLDSPVLTRATRRNIQEDINLHGHRRENLTRIILFMDGAQFYSYRCHGFSVPISQLEDKLLYLQSIYLALSLFR
jgi:hypothetical protein